MSQKWLIGIVVVVVVAAVAGLIWAKDHPGASSTRNSSSTQASQSASSQKEAAMVTNAVTPTTLPDGLIVQDETVGTGTEAKEGSIISVNYVGTLTDGTKFDSSYDRGQPATFTLDPNSLIKGWVEGIPGMKVGGKRKLTVPPSLGYGDQDMGTIPPNSTLVFEIELLGVQ